MHVKADPRGDEAVLLQAGGPSRLAGKRTAASDRY